MENRKGNHNIEINICMSVLSIMDLIILIFSMRRKRAIIYYDLLPIYIGGISRLFKLSDEKMASILSALSGIPMRKIKDGSAIPDYANMHLGAMEIAVIVSKKLLPEIETDCWVRSLDRLIGKKPSLAHAVKYLSWYQFFKYVLPMMVCSKCVDPGKDYIVCPNPLWPSSWHDIIRQSLKDINFGFFKWPLWYVSLRKFLVKIELLTKLLNTTLLNIFKKGVRLKKISKKHFKIISEFYDPERLNGTPYDADCWADGVHIKKDDILLFLSDKQKKVIIQNGYSIKDILKLCRDKGYRLVMLDKLPYSAYYIWRLWAEYFKFVKDIFKLRGSFFCKLLIDAWSDYLEFLPLFIHYSSDNLIYLTIPNGRAAVRFNSALVTGLCRKFGIRSVGCQTRSIVSIKTEHYFDCYDIYFSWGPTWHRVMPKVMEFVDRIIEVGCPYLDYLIPQYNKHLKLQRQRKEGNGIAVSIFNCDISDSYHYTRNYNRSFLMDCAELADAFPHCSFMVKTKDTHHVDMMMADDEFCKVYHHVKDNFNFYIDRPRYDYSDILFSSDIVIAIGFTTPAIEALFLGKRIIFYHGLGCGGEVYADMPYLVATSAGELKKLFNQAVTDYSTYTKNNFDRLNNLDPFRDGMALERINKALSEE